MSQKASNITRVNGFDQLKDALMGSTNVTLSTHLLPDGDGLGAQIALFHYLQQSGKKCRVCNPDEVPDRYRFLDPNNQILKTIDEQVSEKSFDPKSDAWVIVDTNDFRRLGKVWPVLSKKSKQIIFIDHHQPIEDKLSSEYPKDTLVFADETSGSIGELLYLLFQALTPERRLSPEIYLGLYVSVMTDTNSFRYSRTTPLTHLIAADAIENGVDPENIYQSIYSSKELSHLQLLGLLLQQVRMSSNKKIAWIEITKEQRQKFMATADDTQSFLNLLLLLRSAEVVCLFREEDNGTVRVSMKSKGHYAVSDLATDMGGGGHEHAAGFAIKQDLDSVVHDIIQKLNRIIKKT